MEVMPADNCNENDIKHWIGELIQNNLLCEYIVDDKAYWQVTGWNKHQKIDKPTYRHPPPQSTLKTIINNYTNAPLIISDTSSNSQQTVADVSLTNSLDIDDSSPTSCLSVDDVSSPERSGVKGNGENINTCKVVSTLPNDILVNDYSADIQEIFQY